MLGLSEAKARGWIAEGLFTVEGGAAAARALIDRGATAIVCGSDLMALGACAPRASAGLTVPGDVSVVGFDDSRLMPFLDPPLTTVRQPVAAMGDAAVDTLVDAIDGQPVPATGVPVQARAGAAGSTGPRPADRRPA